jgi:hypothetical protein
VGKALLIAGYALWCWPVHHWAVVHHHRSLLVGPRPMFVAVAALTFWPVAGLLWALVYPSDVRPATDMRPFELHDQ